MSYHKSVLLLLALSLCTGLQACSPRTGVSNAGSTAALELLKLHNQARLNGLNCGQGQQSAGTLNWSKKLADTAQHHSSDMHQRKRLSHRGRNGSSPQQRLAGIDYQWLAFAENLALGNNPQTVFDGWLNSKDHCLNIINPRYSEMGAAVIEGYWTVLFAQPKRRQ